MLRSLVIRWLVIAAAVWVTDLLFSGMTIKGGLLGLLFVALVFGLVNAIIKPIVQFLTCPLIILTLGLFTLVINTLMLLLTAQLVPGYLSLNGFWTAFFAAIVISIATTLISVVVPDGSD